MIQTFYSSDKTENEFIEEAVKAQLEALKRACIYFKIDFDVVEVEKLITQFVKFSLQSCPKDARLARYLEVSNDFVPLFLPVSLRSHFKSVLTLELFRTVFGIEFDLDHKIEFFRKQEKEYSILKQKNIWSDFRRDCSVLSEYWVEKFFVDIGFESFKFQIKEKTGLNFGKTFEPLRLERIDTESLHVAICATGMVLAGATEEQPLSPILAVSKIYHEYLYYLNSIFDNKHGVSPQNLNYTEKVKDYALASNLVFRCLNKHLRNLKNTSFLSQKQFDQITESLEQVNIEIMMIWFNDINGDITQYFDQNLREGEKKKVLNQWTNHAVQMTAVWTRFFAFMGAISANSDFEKTCEARTITSFGDIWGYGQLINGFKDFTVKIAVADDVREKRCTPQILHALFYANSEDKKFIQEAILTASTNQTDLTWEQKQRFVEIFNKLGTFDFLNTKIEKAIGDFWQIYNSDQILKNSLIERKMTLRMKSLINGSFESWFRGSRYLGK